MRFVNSGGQVIGVIQGVVCTDPHYGSAYCMDIGGKYTGTVSGAMNMMGNFGGVVSPLPLFCLTAALLYGIWAVRARRTAA